eukprot:CAMPEP_0185622472 /NCGR_PEP_ID=MMETSP0436-20130131/59250_1 /TAXON_ID=626734 ORGANISM="Favella taraikaensis, Strain Fe Narragansett Bay" /NCGR_SAMPLE_ID=MMETSP0436 /ASSEMBLY_ACC=CAM_ASM_000390 /LENGTH=47 /DNA_ID= /DNA_START= /DNA_END= /DNA_ORIENTATION=
MMTRAANMAETRMKVGPKRANMSPDPSLASPSFCCVEESSLIGMLKI